MIEGMGLPQSELNHAAGVLRPFATRIGRGAAYALISLLLVLTIEYEMHSRTVLVFAIGVIGLISARLGLAALFVLLLLAILSPSVLAQIVSALS